MTVFNSQSAYEAKNKRSLFGRPLEQNKNGVFDIEILPLIWEIRNKLNKNFSKKINDSKTT